MILVDTSVWVNLLSVRPTLKLSPEGLGLIATCPPVIQEVLQGIRSDLHHRKAKDALLAFPCLPPSLSRDDFLSASDLYRSLRRRGITVRASTDCLIAAIALKYQLPLWAIDRDFAHIAKYCDLRLHERKEL